MSDESGNEDQWLYGDSMNPEPPENSNANESKDNSSDIPTQSGIQDGAMEVSEEQVGSLEPVPVPGEENTTANGGEGRDDATLEEGQIESEEATDGATAADLLNGDDSDSDDDVNVVIGDIKPSTTYTSLNIKRGGLLTSTTAVGDKMKTPGKFSIEEFEAIGTINGMPAHEFNLDQLEDKPWRKPGADITDYFNYGFNEDTWRSYCERQKRIRVHESGVGLAQLGSATGRGVIPVSITNDNSKYSTWDLGGFGPKKAGPPPGRRYAGTIDVIGGGGLASRRGLDKTPPKENVIQVMTADRRDYRGGGRNFPDMSMPPPPAGMPPPFDLPPPPHGIMPPHGMPGPPHGMPGPPHGMPGGPPLMPPSFPPPQHMDPYGGEFYPPPEADPYYHSYEPTQDCQWDPTWAPTSLTMPSSDVKVLTPGPVSTVTTLTPTMVPAPISKVSSKAVVPQPSETSNQDSQEALSPRTPGRGDADGDTPTMALGVVIKQEPKDDDGKKERSKDRDRSEKHKERSHRHRSRSRSTERRSRRHKSRSRSPGHRSHRKKKSRRSEREKSKEESE